MPPEVLTAQLQELIDTRENEVSELKQPRQRRIHNAGSRGQPAWSLAE